MLLREAYLHIDYWADTPDDLLIEDFLVIPYDLCSEFFHGTEVEENEPSSWSKLPPEITQELARLATFRAGRAFVQLAANANSKLGFEQIVEDFSSGMYDPLFHAGAFSHLAPRVYLLGEDSLFGLLTDLAATCFFGNVKSAWTTFDSARFALQYRDWNPRFSELFNNMVDPLMRLRAAQVQHAFLRSSDASPLDFAIHWAMRTDLEYNFYLDGVRPGGTIRQASARWLSYARKTNEKELLAEALEKHALAMAYEDVAETEETWKQAVVNLQESISTVAPDITKPRDQVRLGNLAQSLLRKEAYADIPDYSEALRVIESLLSVQATGPNRIYNLGRRAAIWLNTANNDLAIFRKAEFDLLGAVDAKEFLDLPKKDRYDLLTELFRAQVSVAHRSAQDTRPGAIEKAMETADIVLGADLSPSRVLGVLLAAADLARLRASPDEEQGYLLRGLEYAKLRSDPLRRDIAMRLGTYYFNKEMWQEAASCYGISAGLPDGSITMQQLQARGGDLADWRPDRAERWASYAYGLAGNRELSVSLLESSLARAYTEKARFEAVDTAGLDASSLSTHTRLSTNPDQKEVKAFLQKLEANDLSATRVRFDGISKLASSVCPIVYLNPSPRGTQILVIDGSGLVEIIEAREISGGDLTGWVLGGYSGNSFNLDEGLLLQDEIGGLAKALGRALPEIGQHIASPLSRILRRLKSEAVILIEAGYYPFLPVHAAPYGEDTIDDNDCLAEEFDVIRIPCASMLSDHQRASVDGFLGIGDSVSDGFAPLTWAAKELSAAKPYFSADRYIARDGASATLSEIQNSVSSSSILHLAVHTDQTEHGLSFVLSDGLIPVSDLASALPTIPQLVFAASCSSGRIDFSRDLDDLVGLPASLLASGCETVIGALWPVDDVAASLVVSKFYEGQMALGLEPPAALRRATRWLRQASRSEILKLATHIDHIPRGRLDDVIKRVRESASTLMHPYSAPVHWGAYVVFDRLRRS